MPYLSDWWTLFAPQIAQSFNGKRAAKVDRDWRCRNNLPTVCFVSNLKSLIMQSILTGLLRPSDCQSFRISFAIFSENESHFKELLLLIPGVQLLAEWHVHGHNSPPPHQLKPWNGFATAKLHDGPRRGTICRKTYRRHFGTQGNAGQVRLTFFFMNINSLIDNFPSGNLPFERAASREKNQPLCMAQYYRLLGSCRRAGIERDSQYLPDLRVTAASQHIVVCCRNQMYCVVVKADQIGRLSEDEIFSQLLYILSDAPCLPQTPPMVGILTAEPRRVNFCTSGELLFRNFV